MTKECKKLTHVVSVSALRAVTKYILDKITAPFRDSLIKADRINAIRKKYEDYLEEDKKRKERNEFILGKLDKMRSCTVVQNKYKTNNLGDLQFNSIYNPVPHQERSGYSTSCRPGYNQSLDLPRSENSLLNEIANKYILIPKRHSNWDARAIHQDVTQDKVPDNLGYADWKSKYAILNELKRQEKESVDDRDPVFSNPNAVPISREEKHFARLASRQAQSDPIRIDDNQIIPEKDVPKNEVANETFNTNVYQEEYSPIQIKTISEHLAEINENVINFDFSSTGFANANYDVDPVCDDDELLNNLPTKIDIIRSTDGGDVPFELEAKRRIVGGVAQGEIGDKEVKHIKVENPESTQHDTKRVVIHRIRHPDNYNANAVPKPQVDHVANVISSLDINDAKFNEDMVSPAVDTYEYVAPIENVSYENNQVNQTYQNTPEINDTYHNAPNETITFNNPIDDNPNIVETYSNPDQTNKSNDTPVVNDAHLNVSAIYDTYDTNTDEVVTGHETNDEVPNTIVATSDNTQDNLPASNTHLTTAAASVLDNTEDVTYKVPGTDDVKSFYDEIDEGPSFVVPGTDDVTSFYAETEEGPVDTQGAGDGYQLQMQNHQYYEEQEQAYPIEINEHEETQQNYDQNYETQYSNVYDGTYQQQDVFEQQAAEQQAAQQQGYDQEGYVQSQGYDQQMYEPEVYQQTGYEPYDQQQVYDQHQYQQENYETVQDVQQQLDKEEGYLPEQEVQQVLPEQVFTEQVAQQETEQIPQSPI